MRRFLQWLLGEQPAILRKEIEGLLLSAKLQEERFAAKLAKQESAFKIEQSNLQYLLHAQNGDLQRENTKLMTQNIEIRKAFQHKMKADLKKTAPKKQPRGKRK